MSVCPTALGWNHKIPTNIYPEIILWLGQKTIISETTFPVISRKGAVYNTTKYI